MAFQSPRRPGPTPKPRRPKLKTAAKPAVLPKPAAPSFPRSSSSSSASSSASLSSSSSGFASSSSQSLISRSVSSGTSSLLSDVTIDEETHQLHNARAVRILSLKDCCVSGVALLHNELYVLCHGRVDNQVQVHSTTSYKLLRCVSVPELHRYDDQDMVSCDRSNCLFISDSGNRCIHQVSTNGIVISKWTVPGEPRGLSVTPAGDLLVVCRTETGAYQLVTFHLDRGKLIMRHIKLQSTIKGPCQAIQLSSGHFVVCQHGHPGLCDVNAQDQVTRFYDGVDMARLRCPCHVTIDRDNELLFVADHDNHRVVLLSCSLQFLGDVIKLALPSSLCFDHVTQRLYVGHGCDVTVIQLQHAEGSKLPASDPHLVTAL